MTSITKDLDLVYEYRFRQQRKAEAEQQRRWLAQLETMVQSHGVAVCLGDSIEDAARIIAEFVTSPDLHEKPCE